MDTEVQSIKWCFHDWSLEQWKNLIVKVAQWPSIWVASLGHSWPLVFCSGSSLFLCFPITLVKAFQLRKKASKSGAWSEAVSRNPEVSKPISPPPRRSPCPSLTLFCRRLFSTWNEVQSSFYPFPGHSSILVFALPNFKQVLSKFSKEYWDNCLNLCPLFI